MDKEFEEKCLSKRTVEQNPSVTPITDETEVESLTRQHKNNAEYMLEGAKSLLNSSTPLLSILVGHFAMEHKANQLIALYGYKVESHFCTQMGLSRVVGRKDLAKTLSDIFSLRQKIGYRMTLKNTEEDKNMTEQNVNEKIIPFMEEIDKLIEENK